MKELISKINWKKVRQSIIYITFIFFLNTALWVFLIGNFVPYSKIGEFRLSWIDYLRLSDKVEWYHIWFLYLGIGIGIVISILFIKWWIQAKRKEKERMEDRKHSEAQTLAIVEAIKEKENKDIEKYL